MTMIAQAPAAARPLAAAGNRWLALVLVCLAAVMSVLDATFVTVALPAIQRDLGFSQNGLAWVMNGYLLTFGGLMLLAGRAADLLGRRRVLVAGIALFSAASLACGLAGSQTMLVVARAVQGAGGAVIESVPLSIIVSLFPETNERAKAMSAWSFVASCSGALGVIVGGLLTQTVNWHWIFFINLPIGVLALLLAKPLLPSIPGIGLDKGLDVPGTLAVVAAPVLAVYGIVNAGQAGWGSTLTLACLGAALAVAAAFVAIEARSWAPLVPLRVFRSRTVSVSNLATVLIGATFFGWFFLSPLYTERVLGYDPLQTGLSFLPATVTMSVMALGVSARLANIFGAKRPLVVGLALCAVGMAWFGRAPVDGQFLTDILPPMFLLGLGAGTFFTPLVLIATGGAEPSDSGLVSGLVATSQMIGGAVGLSVLATLAVARSAGLAAAGVAETVALNSGYHAAFLAAAALALAATLVAALCLPDTRPLPA
jgi:EmrB/QacA subfamily drug resistance transporter